MANSYGFNNSIPSTAIAGKYSVHNGEFTGEFYFSPEEAENAQHQLESDEIEGEVEEGSYAVMGVNGSDWCA